MRGFSTPRWGIRLISKRRLPESPSASFVGSSPTSWERRRRVFATGGWDSPLCSLPLSLNPRFVTQQGAVLLSPRLAGGTRGACDEQGGPSQGGDLGHRQARRGVCIRDCWSRGGPLRPCGPPPPLRGRGEDLSPRLAGGTRRSASDDWQGGAFHVGIMTRRSGARPRRRRAPTTLPDNTTREQNTWESRGSIARTSASS